MNKNINIPKSYSKLIAVDAFIDSHKLIINKKEVVFDKHVAQLLETSLEEIKNIVQKESERFPDDFLLRIQENGRESFAFTIAGIFMLAGQINTERGIEICKQLIDLIVGRNPNLAFEILKNDDPFI